MRRDIVVIRPGDSPLECLIYMELESGEVTLALDAEVEDWQTGVRVTSPRFPGAVHAVGELASKIRASVGVE